MTEEGYQVQFRFGSGMTPMVKLILIATLSVFGIILVVSVFSLRTAEAMNRFLGLVPVLTLKGFQVWRAVTYAFVHDVTNPFHILFNMLGLFFFGPDLERNLGSGKRFLAFYLCAAAFGGILQALFSINSIIPIIGASGAIFAIIVASAVITPNRMVILYIFPIKLKYLAMIFVGINLLNALYSLQGAASPVAYITHLGGAAFGFLYIKARPWFNRMKKDMEFKAAIAHEEQSRSEEAELDRLLKKIHDQGLSSLSKKEREFMLKKSNDYREKNL